MKKVLIASLVAFTLAGCADNTSRPDVYTTSQLGQAQLTNYATIVSMKQIAIQDDNSNANSLLSLGGTALGALAGAQVGGGTGKIAGAIVGGLAGGFATNATVGKVQTQKGVEFTVRFDNGQMLTFAQAGDINRYSVGQRVKLVTGSHGTKIDTH